MFSCCALGDGEGREGDAGCDAKGGAEPFPAVFAVADGGAGFVGGGEGDCVAD